MNFLKKIKNILNRNQEVYLLIKNKLIMFYKIYKKNIHNKIINKMIKQLNNNYNK